MWGRGRDSVPFFPLPVQPPGPGMSRWVGGRQVGQQEPCLGLRGGDLLLEVGRLRDLPAPGFPVCRERPVFLAVYTGCLVDTL